MLTINGAHGEGGGQVLRTAVSLSAILTEPIHITNIRVNRNNPGLAAQHLTAVRAAAIICDADVNGDELGAPELTFAPQSPPVAGLYEFNVADARDGGSAGAASLVLQTMLLPLALAAKSSTVTVRGGTHVAWSPSFHYLDQVYLPALAQFGVQAQATLPIWGWYPSGGGAISVEVSGNSHLAPPNPAQWATRGPLEEITGVAVSASLPAHIAQRIRNRAANLLKAAGLPHNIEPERVRSDSPGAGIFLTAIYENSRAGFAGLGKKGKPSEAVAQEAIEALLAFHYSGAALDEHLADQLVLPLALSGFRGTITTERVSSHTQTALWVVEQFVGPVALIRDNCIEFIKHE